jgi:predicted CoA-binding protein
MLREYEHEIVLVNPREGEIEGERTVNSLAEIQGPVDTVTVYVGPAISSKLELDFLRLRPKRVIFNPGAENPSLEESLRKAGIHVVQACTLVLLRTNQFEAA